MPKERALNPTAAHHKAEKQKAINKNKKTVQSQRSEKLSKRNPERLQKRIDELKDLEASGTLRAKDKEILASLERDLRGVKKARDALGDAAPKFAERRAGGVREEQRERRDRMAQQQGHLGKRRRGEEHTVGSESESGGETDPDVRRIPMPKDTPLPFPRPRRDEAHQVDENGRRVPHALPAKLVPAAPAQTTYSSAPQLRDLKKEAVRFVPAAVAQQKARVKGVGRLLEPEEADKAEQAGYLGGRKKEVQEEERQKSEPVHSSKTAAGPRIVDMDVLEEEARRFEADMAAMAREEGANSGPRGVVMEEVADEGD
nr:hypothetical protein B0A51_18657 [Rachicladosporium sp. CCFEE 5018]